MTPPIIYNADPVTGEFIGTAHADPDPLNPGNWLLPAHSCLAAPPPAGPGVASVRQGDGWLVVPDHRGTVYSTETGEPLEFSNLGDLPYGLTATPRPSEAHRWSAEGWRLDPAIAAGLVATRRRVEILAALATIDAASARPLRAILVGSATDEDRARLTELDDQAAALRAELATLEPPPAA